MKYSFVEYVELEGTEDQGKDEYTAKKRFLELVREDLGIETIEVEDIYEGRGE
jgi:hypothetical protein